MFQQILIIGYLGRDPEMRYTPGGQPVTSFSVATSCKYTVADGAPVSETTWFRVSAWGKQAEICNQYLHKGSRVMVEGRLTVDPKSGGPRIWSDQNGSPRASFEITASTVRFLSGKDDDEPQHETNSQEPENIPVDPDIPF